LPSAASPEPVRFRGVAYRAHSPVWSFAPLSGDGAAVHGGRFNSSGTPALYLSLDIMTAVREANQAFAFKIDPCVLCAYEVDCEDIIDLCSEAARAAQGVSFDELACRWLTLANARREPPSWALSRRLIKAGAAGLIAPSFAPGSGEDDCNLVLWKWGSRLPHKVTVHDPSGRLPKNALSWR
jgi:RES domain-containing protein